MTKKTLHTGIRNLDRILGGGIEYRDGIDSDPAYPSFLLIGDPGCGKTTIALTIARAAGAQGLGAAYFTLEEKPADLSYLAAQFSPPIVPSFNNEHKNETPYILDSNFLQPGGEFAAEIEQAELESNPRLLISYYPENASSAHGRSRGFLSHVDQRVLALKKLAAGEHFATPRVIVIDSILDRRLFEAVDTPWYRFWSIGNSSPERGLFKGLCELGAVHDCILILVAERTSAHDWREFVADIVMNIEWERSRQNEGEHVRRARIVKSRYQPSIAGAHAVRIETGKGVRCIVDPAHLVDSIRSHRNRINRISSESQNTRIRFSCDSGLNAFLRHTGGSDFILKGSTILLYGEDETRKNVFATRFLQELMADDPNASGLVIASGTIVPTAEHLIRKYALDNGASNQFLERLRFLRGPSTLESLADFLLRVDDAIESLASAGYPVSRAISVDGAAMPSRETFEQNLKDLLSTHGITSLFVSTIDHGQDDPYREKFDTTIRSRILETQTHNRGIGYRVLRHQGASAGNTNSWRLMPFRHNESMMFSDAFGFYSEDAEGRLNDVPCILRLYHPMDVFTNTFWDNKRERVFARYFIDDDNPRISSFGRLDADTLFETISDIPSPMMLPSTEVVNVDEFWGETLMRNDRLEEVSRLFSEDEFQKWMSRFPETVTDHLPQKDGKFYAVPHHLDAGIYFARKDILDKLDKWSAFKSGVSWDQIMSTFAEIKAKPAKLTGAVEGSWSLQDGIPLKAVDVSANRIPESFLCFILEVIWESLFSEDGFCGFANNRTHAALVALYEALRDGDSLPLLYSDPSIPKPRKQRSTELTGKGKSIFPIVERHWYVSYCWRVAMKPHLKDDLVPIPAPILKTSAGAMGCASMRGDWNLAILKGSANQSLAGIALSMLTSKHTSQLMASDGIGLPVDRNVLNSEFSWLDAAARHECAVSRRLIPRYHEWRSTLQAQFRDLFCGPVIHDRSDLEDRIIETTSQIESARPSKSN